MEGYSVKILESSRELSGKERVMVKDTSNAIKLDEVANEGSFVIEPKDYVILGVHNDKSDNPDYTLYVILASDGNKYVTGSPSFWNAFTDIWTEMEDESEDYSLEIYKLDSKNYKGKKFLTCSIV